jgi:hypothetical protein
MTIRRLQYILSEHGQDWKLTETGRIHALDVAFDIEGNNVSEWRDATDWTVADALEFLNY